MTGLGRRTITGAILSATLGLAAPLAQPAEPEGLRIQVRAGNPATAGGPGAATTGEGSATPVVTVPGGRSVGAGVFDLFPDARRVRDRLAGLGFPGVRMVALRPVVGGEPPPAGTRYAVWLGTWPERAEAEAVRRRLDRRGMRARTAPLAGGAGVVAGDFADAAAAFARRDRLRGAGLTGARILVVPPPARQRVARVEAAGVSAAEARHAAALAAREAGPAAGVETWVRTLASGERVRITRRRWRQRVLELRLAPFSEYAEADRVARRLDREGFSPMIYARPGDGYGLSLGIYLDADEARRQQRRLRRLGFPGSSLRSFQTWVTRYSVRPAGPDGARRAGETERDRGGVLVFGESPVPQGEAPAEGGGEAAGATSAWRAGPGQMRVEAGRLLDPEAEVRGSHYLRAEGALEWNPGPDWTVRAGVRADGYVQTGDPAFEIAEADYGPTFVRRRWGEARLTVGAQTVVWGRMDELPPSDGLSVRDGRRFLLDELADRRLAVPAVRLEWFAGSWKVDLLAIPRFRPAALPDRDSLWFPIDRRRGQILGLAPDPRLAELVSRGSIGLGAERDAEGGIRLSYQGGRLDFGLTLQRERRSLPYWELDPAVRQALLAGQPPATAVTASGGDTFQARHPRTWLAGGDAAVPLGNGVWRVEVAWLSDRPATTEDLRLVTVPGLDWAVGPELYPGGGDVRLTLQVTGRHRLTRRAVLDRTDAYRLTGSLRLPFRNGRWQADLRFLAGLNESEHYLNPELSFRGWQPQTLYLGAHFFGGAGDTAGGFHDRHDLVVAGWRYRY